MDHDQFQKGFRKKFIKVRTAKGRKASSTKWLQRQLNDPYVIMAKSQGYRSRAAFKILEIEGKYKILQKAKNIVDLGCAPGGWLQVIRQVKPKTSLIGIDLIEIEPMEGVDFIHGNFLDLEIKDLLLEKLGGKQVDLVLSDISPDNSGHKDTDHMRLMAIIEDIMVFNEKNLEKGGNFISKIFLGSESNQLIKELKKLFNKVKLFKPNSSRKDSTEQFLICQGYK